MKFIVGWKTENEWELTFVSVVHIIIIVKSPILSSTSIWCVCVWIKVRENWKGNQEWTMATLGTQDTGRRQKKTTKQHRKLKRWLTQTPTKTAGRTLVLGKG
jgi:hypothetical protein